MKPSEYKRRINDLQKSTKRGEIKTICDNNYRDRRNQQIAIIIKIKYKQMQKLQKISAELKDYLKSRKMMLTKKFMESK